MTYFRIQPSEFWNMTIEEFAALLYNRENQGVDPMTVEDLQALKKTMGVE